MFNMIIQRKFQIASDNFKYRITNGIREGAESLNN